MGLVVGGSGTKTKTASGNTGKIRDNSGIGGGAAALREDLSRATGIDTGQPKGYQNTLANALSEMTTPTPEVKSTSRKPAKPMYSGISGGTPVVSSQPSKSSSTQTYKPYKPVSFDFGTNDEPGIHTASMSTPQKMADNKYDKVGEWGSRGTDVHGNEMEEKWFPWEEYQDTNDIYERDMLAQGMSMDYLDNILRRDDTIDYLLEQGNELDPKLRKDLQNQLADTIDDGTLDRPHLLSDLMDGKQYYHYVHDLGLPGMPEELIDTRNGQYSKKQQQSLYDFPPYVPNTRYGAGLNFAGLLSSSEMLSDWIGNARTNGLVGPLKRTVERAVGNTFSNYGGSKLRSLGNNILANIPEHDVDYDITTDTGHHIVNTFSGSDFEKMLNGYMSQSQDLYDKAAEGDSDAFAALTTPSDDKPYTTMVREYSLPDGSKHYGVITKKHRINDLDNNDDYKYDLIFGDTPDREIRDEDIISQDENGTRVAFGNAIFEYSNDRQPLRGTIQTKDGFTLNMRPSPEGGFELVNDDEAYNNWYDSHYGNNEYIAFSDGSSVILPTKDVNNGKEEWVHYYDTDLKDRNGFDQSSLTVGNPTSLKDTYGKTGSEVGIMYVPDMVLPDGTAISRDVVNKIGNDENPDDWEDDGISYDFERSGVNPLRMLLDSDLPDPLKIPATVAAFGINPVGIATDSRPRRFMHDEIIDDDGLHLGLIETPNWMTDAALNSIPISTPGYQFVDAYSNALPYAAGVESASRDEYGRYQTTGYDPGSDENVIKIGTTMLSPYLENLAGYGHEPFIDPFVEKLIDSKFADETFLNLLLKKTWDSAGEAGEEVIGNYFDEPGTYGAKYMWADPIAYPYANMGDIYDKDHNLLFDKQATENASDKDLSKLYEKIMKKYGQNGRFPVLYDEHGREFRNPNTPIMGRFTNAFSPTPENLRDTANAALGGAGVSWLYSMPELLFSGIGSLAKSGSKIKNKNLSEDEWKIGSNSENANTDVYANDEVEFDDRISPDSYKYRIDPDAKILFNDEQE